jgi:hypothetical protein
MQERLNCVLLLLVLTLVCGPTRAAAPTAESIVELRTLAGKSVASERDEQAALFDYYFQEQHLKYETRLAELKMKASVPAWRIPYSTEIHPLSWGGLSAGGRGRSRYGGSSALATYDRAFNEGQGLADSYESRRVLGGSDRALFPGWRMRRSNEGWEGYCSGFTASTIRHPEPVKAVDAGTVGGRAGVVIQPAEIKALLCAIYNHTTEDSFLYLAPPSARDGGPNMGTFHLALANYIGEAGHPLGINRTKGVAAWNNPVYAYEVTSIQDGETVGTLHYKTVETTITYTFYGSDAAQQTDAETGDRQGHTTQAMAFRYALALDADGRIVGGSALSYNGHFLWLPLYAVQGKQDGSLPGNPYLDVHQVLTLARAAALPEVQKKFDQATVGIQPQLAEAELAPAASGEPAEPQADSAAPTEP